jgi:hypothetical protein
MCVFELCYYRRTYVDLFDQFCISRKVSPLTRLGAISCASVDCVAVSQEILKLSCCCGALMSVRKVGSDRSYSSNECGNGQTRMKLV